MYDYFLALQYKKMCHQRWVRSNPDLNLLRVCRLINEEALRFLLDRGTLFLDLGLPGPVNGEASILENVMFRNIDIQQQKRFGIRIIANNEDAETMREVAIQLSVQLDMSREKVTPAN